MLQGPVASLIIGGGDRLGQIAAESRRIAVAIDVNLEIFDEPLTGQILVADRPAGLAEVVPVARSLSDEIVRRVIKHRKRTGLNVTCKKDCAACCRYLVPLSVPEVFCMWDELQAAPPTQQQQVISAFVNASQQILQAGPPPVPQTRITLGENPQDSQKVLNRWYAGIGVDCPFLERAVCTAYSSRPIACREHMVTSSAEHCLPEKDNQARRLELPFSIVEALGILSAEVEDVDLESVMLPFAPAWRQINHGRARRTWPAPDLFEHFAAIVHDLASRRRSAAA